MKILAKSVSEFTPDDLPAKLVLKNETSRPDIEKMTGLISSNRTVLCNDQERLIAELHKFMDEHTKPNRDILCWSGQDSTLLGVKCLDVYAVYKTWLTANKIMRKNNIKLSNAVMDLFGPSIAYEPHRAYEDAVATAAVLRICVNHLF